jgi:hypothetical protein
VRLCFPDGIVLVASLAASCGSPNTIVITQSRTTAPGPVERIEVFVSLPARGGDRGIYHGFKKVMPTRLARCAISSSIVAGMPPADAALAAGSSASPSASPAFDAQLIVRARYGQLSTVTTVDQYGNTLDEKAFKKLELDLWLELFDHELNRITWQAFANIKLEDNKGTVAGEKLAGMIVDRLRSDGVLEHCD